MRIRPRALFLIMTMSGFAFQPLKSLSETLPTYPAKPIDDGMLSSAARHFTVQGTIPADWPTGSTYPVRVPAPDNIDGKTNWIVDMTVDGHDNEPPHRLAAQYEPPALSLDKKGSLWLLLTVREQDRGKKITVRGESHESDKPATVYTSTFEDPELHIHTPDGKLILSYWHGEPNPKLKYPLTDFIHPVMGLYGETITDLCPKDHLHHRGIFWSWVRYDRNGQSAGSWWIPDHIRCLPDRLASSDGPIFSRFESRHWLAQQLKPSASQASVHSMDSERFIQEDLVCRIFPTASNGRAMDVDISILALEDNVHIGGQTTLNKGYGGMTLRYGPAKDIEIAVDGKIYRQDLIGHRARWADWTGLFNLSDGQPAPGRSGAAILVAPDHPDAPPTWLTRHYGALCVTYPGLEMLKLSKDRPLRLRYRIWVHRGDADIGRVDDQYKAFAADWQWRTSDEVAVQ